MGVLESVELLGELRRGILEGVGSGVDGLVIVPVPVGVFGVFTPSLIFLVVVPVLGVEVVPTDLGADVGGRLILTGVAMLATLARLAGRVSGLVG